MLCMYVYNVMFCINMCITALKLILIYKQQENSHSRDKNEKIIPKRKVFVNVLAKCGCNFKMKSINCSKMKCLIQSVKQLT